MLSRTWREFCFWDPWRNLSSGSWTIVHFCTNVFGDLFFYFAATDFPTSFTDGVNLKAHEHIYFYQEVSNLSLRCRNIWTLLEALYRIIIPSFQSGFTVPLHCEIYPPSHHQLPDFLLQVGKQLQAWFKNCSAGKGRSGLKWSADSWGAVPPFP